jgi:predicted kinase
MEIKSIFKALSQFLMSDDSIFKKMEATTEGSMHHREANVLEHTKMVLNQYYNITPDEWNMTHLEGAFACLFHDTGKPAAEVDKFTEERGHYHSYPGHEIISARCWENWIVEHYNFVKTIFPEFIIKNIYNIGWMVEHHLPYNITNKHKLECIYKTGKIIGGNAFADLLFADGTGRINDNAEIQAIRIQTWLDSYNNYEYIPVIEPTNIHTKRVYMFIGPSSAGKTFVIDKMIQNNQNMINVFSIDALIKKWYSDLLIMDPETQYIRSHNAALADNGFIKRWQREYINIIKSNKDVVIDGTNLTTKERRFFLDIAKFHNRYTHATYMTSSLPLLNNRHSNRNDKVFDMNVIEKQYSKLQYPSYHEFDEIHIL